MSIIRELDEQQRPATGEQQQQLARWSAWGAIPEVFEPHREDWQELQTQLLQLLDQDEYRAAAVTTLNAHYTRPDVAQAMWAALHRAGFSGGSVLEPGCGSGTFIGLAPTSAHMVGVEIDPISAKIAHRLYPQAHIHNQGFERAWFNPQGTASFTAGIGNVPFGGFVLPDPQDNPRNLSIHNHFIVKALKNIAPGGYGIFLTSTWTMDAQTSTARREISALADFLGAVRLPSGAMSRVAGTDATTDILVLRRRAENQTPHPAAPAWLKANPVVEVEGVELTKPPHLNEYFQTHRENLLGDLSVENTMYGTNSLAIRGPVDEQMLTSVTSCLDKIVDQGLMLGLGHQPDPVELRAQFAEPGLSLPDPKVEALKPGHVTVINGAFMQWEGREFQPFKIPATRKKETLELLKLRDAAVQVIETQRNNDTQEAKATARARLLAHYNTYVQRFGPINRFSLTEPSVPSQAQVERQIEAATKMWRRTLIGEMSAEDRQQATPPENMVEEWRAAANYREPQRRQDHLAALQSDPDFALVLALEDFDPDTQTATTTAIFTHDVLAAPTLRTSADDPSDALAICLDEQRTVDLERIGELLNLTPQQAFVALEGLVFRDPQDPDHLIASVQYLSGNVRQKLDMAIAASADDERLAVNVNALQQVLPQPVPLDDVTLHPGVKWIDKKHVTRFVAEVLKVSVTISYDQVAQKWELTPQTKVSKSQYDPSVYLKFGVDTRSPVELLASTMNNDFVTVTKTVAEKKTAVDQTQTKLAREKQGALINEFHAWVMRDEHLRAELEVTYNALFNSYVAPDYSQLGQRLALPGLNPEFIPHHYQRAAVAQMLHDPTVLLDHVVGAGKTATMVMGAMELRRNNLVRKPWIVVPNHLTHQVAREFLHLYPAANILLIPTGANDKTRRAFIARSAAADWDAVICPESTFTLIGIDAHRAQEWLDEERELISTQYSSTSGDQKQQARSRKKIEASIKRLEARFAQQIVNKDRGLTFEATGCDYLIVDEAHHYKNLRRVSSHQELACSGSLKADDLAWKLRALRETRKETYLANGGVEHRFLPTVATFATGTPIANSLSESWVMQMYMRPDIMKHMGLDTVDSWAVAFTIPQTKMEIGSDGVSWKLRTRIGAFTNLPELLAINMQFTSVVTRDALTATVPALKNNTRTISSRPASAHVREYVTQLAHRANNLPPDPSVDNLLKITNDGRMIALDPQTLGHHPDPDGGRAAMVAESVITIHNNDAHTIYLDDSGNPHPVTGGLQIVFCDRSIPNDDGYSIYTDIKNRLVEAGMASEKIKFIHQATNDVERARMFEEARHGGIHVLIGSTSKMGTGMNVQNRVSAIHHVDCPWRPADLEQREGRGIRQRNQNSEVEVIQYITEGTFDAVFWQIVTRKATFIQQLKTAQVGQRTVSDVDSDMVISAATASAIATGDPRILQRAELLEKIAHIETLTHAKRTEKADLERNLRVTQSMVEDWTKTISGLSELADDIHPEHHPHFRTAQGQSLHERTDIGRYLIGLIKLNTTISQLDVGSMGNVKFAATHNGDGSVWVHLQDAPTVGTNLPADRAKWSESGLGTRLVNLYHAIPGELAAVKQRVETETARINDVREVLQTLTIDSGELVELQLQVEAIDKALGGDDDDQEHDGKEERIEGDDIRRLGSSIDTRNTRIGDIVTGIKGHPGFWKRVDSDSEERWQQTFIPLEQDDPTPQVIIEHNITLVSRLRSEVEPINLYFLDNHINASPVTHPSNGATLTVYNHETNDIVTGILEEIKRGETFSIEAYIIRTNTGRQIEVCPRDKSLVVYEHRQSKSSALERMTRIGHVVQSLSAEAISGGVQLGDVVLMDNYDKVIFLNPETNTVQVLKRSEVRDIQFTEGPRVSGAELTRADMLPEEVTVEDLRAGDLVYSSDIDKTAALREPVMITWVGYGMMKEISYTNVAKQTDHTCKRKSDMAVELISRPVALLNLVERLKLIYGPKVRVMDADSAHRQQLSVVTQDSDGRLHQMRIEQSGFARSRSPELRIKDGEHSQPRRIDRLSQCAVLDQDVHLPTYLNPNARHVAPPAPKQPDAHGGVPIRAELHIERAGITARRL